MNQASAAQFDRGSSYRERETQAVLTAWAAGQSVSVVGVGSAGKSNFIQHLSRLSERGEAEDWLPIVIDANLLGPLTGPDERASTALAYWAGCELLLHRAFMALYPFTGFKEDERTTVYEAYEALQDGSNPLYAMLALRYLELGLSVALRKGLRLAFLFDEFEHCAASLPTTFFQSLRGLRDLYKRRLVFMTASRAPLDSVMASTGHHPLQSESFVELFSDHVVYLGPFARHDAEAMIGDLLARRGATLSAAATESLLKVTGAHPGLLRAALHAALDQPALARLSARDLSPALLHVPAIFSECAAIWGGLTPPEQMALMSASAAEPEPAALLQLKGLITYRGQVTPPVFAHFVAQQVVE